MIGLDLGTTNCKAVLLDEVGQVRAKASEGYALQIPHPGWAEQDVRVVWAAAQKVLRAVAESVAEGAARPQGICISGAMHSLFPVADKAGTPLSNAMTWADARATAVYRGLIADTDTHALYRRTGCPVHSTYHLQRLRWWNRVEPEQAERALVGGAQGLGPARADGGLGDRPEPGFHHWVAQPAVSDVGHGRPAVGGHPARAPAAAGFAIGGGGRADGGRRGRHRATSRPASFYKQQDREYRALRRGMMAMGEALENLKESYL